MFGGVPGGIIGIAHRFRAVCVSISTSALLNRFTRQRSAIMPYGSTGRAGAMRQELGRNFGGREYQASETDT